MNVSAWTGTGHGLAREFNEMLPKPKRPDPIGYCIYCGSTEDLRKEHVVPYSLGGGAWLPKASCPICADVTSRFEGFIARDILGAFRIRTGAPTRRPKQRPSILPLELIDVDGSRREVEVTPQTHPATLLLPDLPEPSLLLPVVEGDRRPFRMWLGLPDADVLNLPTEHGAAAMRLGSFEIGSFYLLLAKVAHAGAFLDPEWTTVWEPLLPDLIVGDDEDYDRLIGGSGTDEFADDDASFPFFFRSVDVENERYLVAFFRFFGQNKTPIYQVVVGRRR